MSNITEIKSKEFNIEEFNISELAFLDLEVAVKRKNKQIFEDVFDYGVTSYRASNNSMHSSNQNEFANFIKDFTYLVGHNIINFDKKYMVDDVAEAHLYIDTLHLSPLLFPNNPSYALAKAYKEDLYKDYLSSNDFDTKAKVTQLNNPLEDAKACQELFELEVSAFFDLEYELKEIFASLLSHHDNFKSFFKFINYQRPINKKDLIALIQGYFNNQKSISMNGKFYFCNSADLERMISDYPVDLAYCLSTIRYNKYKMLPSWVSVNYKDTLGIMRDLLNTHTSVNDGKCSCNYCQNSFDIHKKLKEFFNYDNFRTYGDNNDNLQEKAVRSAVNHESVLTIFPTGGGKSITFQLPALMSGQNSNALTVVISPLISLMKDQDENLKNANNDVIITNSAYINSTLNSYERHEIIQNVKKGFVNILYISPESLRINTIEKLLIGRDITRFVIDEAHCLSMWGQDFRVDYLYIGEFIKFIQDKKNLRYPIPVSCFTATAKPAVINDIVSYFKNELDIDFEYFTTNATRTNLSYKAYSIAPNTNDTNIIFSERFKKLNAILLSNVDYSTGKICPTIIYVSSTNTAQMLSELINSTNSDNEALQSVYYHGKLRSSKKLENQELFMTGNVNIMVATSAFGMGVDKSDISLIIHFNISGSLENYLQEAGRAGRNPNINAECCVLFHKSDLRIHFNLLSNSRITKEGIQNTFEILEKLTEDRNPRFLSYSDILNDTAYDMYDILKTKINAQMSALEKAKLIKRGKNSYKAFYNNINIFNLEECKDILDSCHEAGLSDEEKKLALEILKTLFVLRFEYSTNMSDADFKIDNIVSALNVKKSVVIKLINTMVSLNILHNSFDMDAIFKNNSNNVTVINKSTSIIQIELLLLAQFNDYPIPDDRDVNIRSIDKINLSTKSLTTLAQNIGIANATLDRLTNIIKQWVLDGYLKKTKNFKKDDVVLELNMSKHDIYTALLKKFIITEHIVKYIYGMYDNQPALATPKECDDCENAEDVVEENKAIQVNFSIKDIKDIIISEESEQADLTDDFYDLYSEQNEALLEHLKISEIVDIADINNTYLNVSLDNVTYNDIHHTLSYIYKNKILDIQGNLLTLYNKFSVEVFESASEKPYSDDDYKDLEQYYRNKLDCIHIVGEYAERLIADTELNGNQGNKGTAFALERDYFNLSHDNVMDKYFNPYYEHEEDAEYIELDIESDTEENFSITNYPVTQEQYDNIFNPQTSPFSEEQKMIIDNFDSKYINVLAGPGSGKTRVLTYKLASLLLRENVETENLLVLTFSKSASLEFRHRLRELLNSSLVYDIDIQTTSAFCLDLLGRVLEKNKNTTLLQKTINSIDYTLKLHNNEIDEIIEDSTDDIIDTSPVLVDISKLIKTAIIIDEAQDMDKYEFEIIERLLEFNKNARVIIVGDNNQNIYKFRQTQTTGDHLSDFINKYIHNDNAVKYELRKNYRSNDDIVIFCNSFIEKNRSDQNMVSMPSNYSMSVGLFKYANLNELYEEVVANVIAYDQKGSVRILTSTNDEVRKIGELFKNKNIEVEEIYASANKKTTFVYSTRFSAMDIVEIRFFIDYIYTEITSEEAEINNLELELELKLSLWLELDVDTDTNLNLNTDKYFISDQLWENAENATLKKFTQNNNNTLQTLSSLEFFSKVLQLFTIEFKHKHFKDLVYFIRNTDFKDIHKVDFQNITSNSTLHNQIEDTVVEKPAKISISTIHQAKGLEYDNIYLCVKDKKGLGEFKSIKNPTEEQLARRRAKRSEEISNLYVGMTRAKKSLNIHYLDYDYNNTLFASMPHSTPHLIPNCNYNAIPAKNIKLEANIAIGDSISVPISLSDINLSTVKYRNVQSALDVMPSKSIINPVEIMPIQDTKSTKRSTTVPKPKIGFTLIDPVSNSTTDAIIFSKNFCDIYDDYKITHGIIDFVVLWQDHAFSKEYKVPLAILTLTRYK